MPARAGPSRRRWQPEPAAGVGVLPLGPPRARLPSPRLCATPGWQAIVRSHERRVRRPARIEPVARIEIVPFEDGWLDAAAALLAARHRAQRAVEPGLAARYEDPGEA